MAEITLKEYYENFKYELSDSDFIEDEVDEAVKNISFGTEQYFEVEYLDECEVEIIDLTEEKEVAPSLPFLSKPDVTVVTSNNSTKIQQQQKMKSKIPMMSNNKQKMQQQFTQHRVLRSSDGLKRKPETPKQPQRNAIRHAGQNHTNQRVRKN